MAKKRRSVRPQDINDRKPTTPHPTPSATGNTSSGPGAGTNPAGDLFPTPGSTGDVVIPGSSGSSSGTSSSSSGAASSSGSSAEGFPEGATFAATTDPYSGYRILQAVIPGVGNEPPTIYANVTLTFDRNGNSHFSNLNDSMNRWIKKLKSNPSEFQWFKNKFIASGLMSGKSANADINNPEFIRAFSLTLMGMSVTNFTTPGKRNASNTFTNPKDFLSKTYSDTPEVIDVRKTSLAATKRIAMENGVTLSIATLNEKANAVALGLVSQDSVNLDISKKAAILYPQFSQFLNTGSTLKSLLEPYVATTQHILEIDDDINLSDPKSPMRHVLGYKDSKGNSALMPLYDYEVALKQDPRWMKTKNATETFANLYSTLKQGFGLG